MEWIYQVPLLFFSVVIHEVSHGLVAWFRGDDTAEAAGRLTLNPIPHIDPFGTIIFPVCCYVLRLPMFAWAIPVPVNPRRLRSPRADMMGVALVGPASNVALAFASALAFRAAMLLPFFTRGFQMTLVDAMTFMVRVNLLLAFFNLIPIHPLDGSKVLSGLLPAKIRRPYERHFPYGMLIILALMMTKLMVPLVVLPTQATLQLMARIGLIW